MADTPELTDYLAPVADSPEKNRLLSHVSRIESDNLNNRKYKRPVTISLKLKTDGESGKYSEINQKLVFL